MKIDVIEGAIVLKEVYSGVGLLTNSGEFMRICMKDSGFEFHYEGKQYEAKNGLVTLVISNEAIPRKRDTKNGEKAIRRQKIMSFFAENEKKVGLHMVYNHDNGVQNHPDIAGQIYGLLVGKGIYAQSTVACDVHRAMGEYYKDYIESKKTDPA